MDKDTILQMSREENVGRPDEREQSVASTAAKTGMLVGCIVCVALVFLDRFVLHVPEVALAAWMVYFAMYGSSNIVLYRKLRNRRNLDFGIIAIVAAAGLCAAMVIKSVM
ncbi:MAG: hypothetical protein IKX54_06065 [Lachnospiraceae bacterium]|nr:hypothetical protein [Lachnospiraceae bacterium]